jgi:hypothetical protein
VVDRHALAKDAEALDSIACEGALLAHDAAKARTTDVFVREHASALSVQAANYADALGRRKTAAEIRGKVRRKAKEAAALAATLERLRDHPGDRTLAASIEGGLTRLVGGCG